MHEAPGHGEPAASHGESHLPTYNKVVVLLSVLTAVEFGIAFAMPKHGTGFLLGVLGLLALAGWKAVWVARFFMHLRYDPKALAFIACIPIILITPILILVGFDLVNGPNL